MQDTRPVACAPTPTFGDFAFIEKVFAAMIPQYAPIMPGSFEANLENLRRLQEKNLDFTATGLAGYVVETDTTALGFIAVGPLSPRLAYLLPFTFYPNTRDWATDRRRSDRLKTAITVSAIKRCCYWCIRKPPGPATFIEKWGIKPLLNTKPASCNIKVWALNIYLSPTYF